MASIRKRGRSWEAQVRVRGWEPQTRTFTTKADAAHWASEREAEMRRGTFVDITSLRSVAVIDLLERYLAEATPTKKGAEPESYRLRAMMRTSMAKLTLDRVSTSVVVEWRDARRQTVAADTVRRELNLLSSVFSYARSEWHLPLSNPVEGVRRPKQGRGRSRRPSWSELKLLLRELAPRVRGDGLRSGTRNHWARPAVLFALRTAMRRGEILALRWEDVDFSERRVRIRDSKNGEPRDIPLSRKAELLLRRLPKGCRTSGVFPTTASALEQVFDRAISRAGIDDLRFHDLRHDATTRLARRLTNVLELSAVTGHKSLTMLKRYYNPTAAELAQKLD